MSEWSLPQLFSTFHEDVERRLSAARKSLGHSVSKGDASERVWIDVLGTYLPKRYQVERAFIVDSNGRFSDQLDVVVFDQQYSPFILSLEGQAVLPAESVYAVLEAKQSIDATQVAYARRKVDSVRALHRTSLPIPHAGGTHDARKLPHIIGGLLTLDSDWSPPLGQPLADSLIIDKEATGFLDIGCVAAHGWFNRGENGDYTLIQRDKAATAFLLELISRLQQSATVPMIDVHAYAKWLDA